MTAASEGALDRLFVRLREYVETETLESDFDPMVPAAQAELAELRENYAGERVGRDRLRAECDSLRAEVERLRVMYPPDLPEAIQSLCNRLRGMALLHRDRDTMLTTVEQLEILIAAEAQGGGE